MAGQRPFGIRAANAKVAFGGGLRRRPLNRFGSQVENAKRLLTFDLPDKGQQLPSVQELQRASAQGGR